MNQLSETKAILDAGMMTAKQIVQQVEHCAIFTNNIMRTYGSTRLGESLQRLIATVLCRVMDDHIIRATH